MKQIIPYLIAFTIIGLVVCSIVFRSGIGQKTKQKKENKSINSRLSQLDISPKDEGRVLLEKFRRGEISLEELMKRIGKMEVFYSTPYGDHKDGTKKLFVLQGPKETGYNPVFTSQDRITEFYNEAGREAYMIIKGDLLSFVKVTDKTNEEAPVKLGVVIDPNEFGFKIDAMDLKEAIAMMESK